MKPDSEITFQVFDYYDEIDAFVITPYPRLVPPRLAPGGSGPGGDRMAAANRRRSGGDRAADRCRSSPTELRFIVHSSFMHYAKT